jgi:hypothetical protein
MSIIDVFDPVCVLMGVCDCSVEIKNVTGLIPGIGEGVAMEHKVVCNGSCEVEPVFRQSVVIT